MQTIKQKDIMTGRRFGDFTAYTSGKKSGWAAVMTKTRVVLIAHKYPPFSGVGSNRWAHLSIRFAKNDIDLTILTVERGEVPAPFDKIDIIKTQSWGFYKFLSQDFNTKTLNSFIARAKEILRVTLWFDDEAQYWGKKLLPEIRRLVNENGKIVLIATGHPFQANRWAMQAKKEHGDAIFLIQDFRDPWFDNPFKKYLLNFQKAKVKKWQEEAVKYADVCVYVTKGLRTLFEGKNAKGIVIENGHDFHVASKNRSENSQYIIHAGTLANGRDHAAFPFFLLCEAKPEILGGKKVVFYGRISLWLQNRFSSLFKSGVFILHNRISQEKLVSVYLAANYALQFNAKEYPYLVSTKIYEHSSCGLPTLSINYGGEIEDLIKQNRIGESSAPNVEQIQEAIKRIEQSEYSSYLKKFSLESSFDVRAQQYLNIINSAFKKRHLR